MDISTSLEHVNALCDEGRYEKARQLLTVLAENHPRDGAIMHALGQVFLKINRVSDAANSFEQAILLEPNHPVWHKILADAYAELGQQGMAKQAYLKAVELDQDFFQAHANLANVLLAGGDVDGAIGHYKRAISIRPDVAELHDSLGRALMAKGLTNFAQAAHRHALELKPQLATAHCHLGRLLTGDGHVSEAIGHLQKAVALAPSLVLARLALADALIQDGSTSEVAQILRLAGKLFSDGARLPPEIEYEWQRVEACLAKAEGDYDRAIGILHTLESALGDKEAAEVVHYQLADLYDLAGNYSKAFVHICRAHALSKYSFDRILVRQEVDEQLSLYSATTWPHCSKASHGIKQPVFILGMPRSGKSLTEKLLVSHFGVAGLDEKLALGELLELHRRDYPGLHGSGLESALTTASLDRLARDYIEMAEERLADSGHDINADVRNVVSTSPGNVWILGLIRRVFPEAAIIHIRRDPLDTCCACFFKHFASARHAYANDLEDLGFYYRQYQRVMSHWRDVLDIPMLEIDYEEMVANPAGMQQRLFEYLGLDVGDDGVKPIDTSEFTSKHIGQWKHYRKVFMPLAEEFADVYGTSFER